MKTLFAVGVFSVFSSTALNNLKGDDEFSVQENIRTHNPSSGNSSSCPYIYSWSGKRYVLDAEAFGIAFGKALELKTCGVLPSIGADESRVQIKIANERPETHYINSLQLRGVEVDRNASVVLDPADQPWPIYQSTPPVYGVDCRGNDITEKICTADRSYWESEIDPSQQNSDFEDMLEIGFQKPATEKTGSIIITGINTEFSQSVFKNVFEFLGDESLAFMQAVEHDQEMISTLKNWIAESSLKASLWDGNEWQPIAILHPEATAVPFSRVIRINTAEINGDLVKIKLTSLAEVWKIDAINVDWTPVKQLPTMPVSLISAIGPQHSDVSEMIAEDDDKYTVLLPPENIELTFQALYSSPGKKIVYMLNAQGYLYEWFPPKSEQQLNTLVAFAPSAYRIGYLKNILQHKSVFLPPIYAEWIQTKKRQ